MSYWIWTYSFSSICSLFGTKSYSTAGKFCTIFPRFPRTLRLWIVAPASEDGLLRISKTWDLKKENFHLWNCCALFLNRGNFVHKPYHPTAYFYSVLFVQIGFYPAYLSHMAYSFFCVPQRNFAILLQRVRAKKGGCSAGEQRVRKKRGRWFFQNGMCHIWTFWMLYRFYLSNKRLLKEFQTVSDCEKLSHFHSDLLSNSQKNRKIVFFEIEKRVLEMTGLARPTIRYVF